MSGGREASGLAASMCLIYTNGEADRTNSCMSLFADKSKTLRKVEVKESCKMLQDILGMIYELSQE